MRHAAVLYITFFISAIYLGSFAYFIAYFTMLSKSKYTAENINKQLTKSKQTAENVNKQLT